MILTAAFITQFFKVSLSSVIMIVASAVWFADALAARKAYACEFYASLKQGYLDLTSPIIDFTPDQIRLVKETLVNGEQTQANFVLSSLSHEHIGLFSQVGRDRSRLSGQLLMCSLPGTPGVILQNE